MHKTVLKHNMKYKMASVSKSKEKKKRATNTTASDGLIRTMVTRRIDELSLPPMRTLVENKTQFKRILTERAAESIEQKMRQPGYCRYGEDEHPNMPVTISCFSEPKYKRKIDKVARAKFLSHNKLKASTSGPSRIDSLSKPIQRRLPEPEEIPSICNVKPTTLHHVPNRRIVELAKPKKSQHKAKINKRRKKKSVWKR